jgi:transcriptional regulator with XRE-family HTH domain
MITEVTIGERIRSLRLAKGLKQCDFAKLLGKTQTAVSYWECGRRRIPIDELIKVAAALGITVTDFLEEDMTVLSLRDSLIAAHEEIRQLKDELKALTLKYAKLKILKGED